MTTRPVPASQMKRPSPPPANKVPSGANENAVTPVGLSHLAWICFFQGSRSERPASPFGEKPTMTAA